MIERTSYVEKMMGCSNLMSKVGMTTLVSVSHSLVWPSMLLILPRRYLPLYRGRRSAVTVAASQFFLQQLRNEIN